MTPAPSAHRIDRALALAAVVITLAIRLGHLQDAALWEDEAFRYDLARGDHAHFVMTHSGPLDLHAFNPADSQVLAGFRGVLRGLKADSPYAPGYYVLLHALMRLGVRSPVSLALVNALAAGAVAYCLYRLARRGLSPFAATVAPLLYAFSAWDIGVCMQLKETGLATALALGSTLLLVRALEQQQTRDYAGAGALLGLALLTQQQSLYWAIIQFAVVVRQPRQWKQVLPRAVAAWGLAGLLYLPWFLYAGPAQLQHLRAVNALFGGTWGGLGGLGERLTHYLGLSIIPTGLAASWGSVLGSGLAVTGTVVTLWVAIRRYRGKDVTGSLDIAALGATAWLAGLVLAAVTYVLMKQNQALWPRYSPLFLPGAWLLAAGLAGSVTERLRTPAPLQLLPGAAAATLLLPAPWMPLPLDRYADWATVTAALVPRSGPGDLFVHLPGANALDAFWHAWPHASTHAVGGEPTDAAADRYVQAAKGRIWLVMAWGQASLLPRWEAALGARGWVKVEGLQPRRTLPGPVADMPPTVRVLESDIQVVGFAPQGDARGQP